MAQGGKKGGKARYVAALGQKLAQSPQEDHHGQRHKDRMCADIGDHRPHRRPRQRANQQRQHRAEEERPHPRIHPAELHQHEGQRQPRHVGGVDDGQIEPARDDRDQHGQCQQAEFGQLVGDGAEVGRRQEIGGRRAEDGHDKGEKAQKPRHFGPEGAFDAVDHSRSFRFGTRIAARSMFEVEMAARMMMPTTILKA